MKKLYYSVLIVATVFFALQAYAQKECKVLVSNLEGNYTGKCKKGLAHGHGKAVGTDTYEGNFKKGLPHGEGVYTWANGDVYDGYWKMGLKAGKGTLKFNYLGNDSTLIGIFKDDKYFGPIPIKPEVMQKESISSYNFNRLADGNTVSLDLRLSGQDNIDVEDLMLISSSGSQFDNGSKLGIENVIFPVTVKISYMSWNAARTMRHRVSFEFKITQEGRWDVVIVNH